MRRRPPLARPTDILWRNLSVVIATSLFLTVLCLYVVTWETSYAAGAIEPSVAGERRSARRDVPVARAGDGGPDAAEPARRDPAVALLGDLATGTYGTRFDVASGRFLHDFDEERKKLWRIELEERRPLRRGPGWVQFEAPYLPEGEDEEGWATARLRLVKSEGSWKLEHVTLLPRKFHEER